MLYLVEWKIDEEADNFEEAAHKAWNHMRRLDSAASVFKVTASTGESWLIDLCDTTESMRLKGERGDWS